MNILILGPESRNKYTIEFFKERGDKFSLTTEPISLGFLRENQIDYLISYGYAPILKTPVTTEYKNRIINIHPAYLPLGRGIYTNFWSFFEGRPKGVSIHFIDDGIDTGDVIARKLVEFSDGETLRTTHEKLDRAVEQLFFEVWDDIINNSYQALDQDTLITSSSYRNRTTSERFMDLLPQSWDTPVENIEKLGADCFLAAQFWEKYDGEIQNFMAE
jgi:folate-dependent phosphoribosylglycinamide formyltransferase PurN